MSHTNRPNTSLGFSRRYSTEVSNGQLHVNPKRARTPSMSSSPSTSKVESSVSRETSFQQASSERTPLMSSNSSAGFSHTVSMDSVPKTQSRSNTSILALLAIKPFHKRPFFESIKIIVLFAITILCCVFMVGSEETDHSMKLTAITKDKKVILRSWNYSSDTPNIRVVLVGPYYKEDHNTNVSRLMIGVQEGHETYIDIDQEALKRGETVRFVKDFKCSGANKTCHLTVSTDVDHPLSWNAKALSWQLKNEVYYAFAVLGFVYVLIIFELVHRTLAAMIGALAALAVLSSLNQRPHMDVIIGWIDIETLSLLFGMMILVSIFSETGFFDYSALKAYKMAKGKVWPLITLLCVFSAVVSAFLDNVTTILLMAPVTIRLCEVLNLDPRHILIAEVLFSNIGGTATAIGDPPNVIIVGALQDRGIDFSTFTIHMFPGIILVSIAGYGMLRLYYRNLDNLRNKDPPDIAELKNEIAMWRRHASRIQVVTREEFLMRALFLQKAVETENVMIKRMHLRQKEEDRDMKEMLRKLESQYCIKNNALLIKSGVVLLVVIVLLFIYSFVDGIHLDIGWIAVLGAIWLLVLANITEMENILHKVEWSTLLFFASLFILMEALAELGMIKTIGDGVSTLISGVDKEHRLMLALIIILWVSAIASSFIDNIPYTTAMVPVLVQIHEDPNLQLDLLPMVVALAFGACLGGNGTLIGASANVVCAGIAEQHGHGFSFKEFFKVGFPMMLVSTLVACGYVLFCHAVEWH